MYLKSYLKEKIVSLISDYPYNLSKKNSIALFCYTLKRAIEIIFYNFILLYTVKMVLTEPCIKWNAV